MTEKGKALEKEKKTEDLSEKKERKEKKRREEDMHVSRVWGWEWDKKKIEKQMRVKHYYCISIIIMR